MRTQEEIRKHPHYITKVYFYLYKGDLMREMCFLAADIKEAREIVYPLLASHWAGYKDTIRISWIKLNEKPYSYKPEDYEM